MKHDERKPFGCDPLAFKEAMSMKLDRWIVGNIRIPHAHHIIIADVLLW
jgi:hypothetical protein